MSVMARTSQLEIGPYVASALCWLVHQASTAVCRESLSAKAKVVLGEEEGAELGEEEGADEGAVLGEEEGAELGADDGDEDGAVLLTCRSSIYFICSISDNISTEKLWCHKGASWEEEGGGGGVINK